MQFVIWTGARDLTPFQFKGTKKDFSLSLERTVASNPAKDGYLPLDLAQFRDMISAGGLTMI
jgi:hypothetical protein